MYALASQAGHLHFVDLRFLSLPAAWVEHGADVSTQTDVPTCMSRGPVTGLLGWQYVARTDL